MRLDDLLKPLRHSPRWLLCLALLLPLAQLAATWHAVSHHGPQSSQRDHDSQAPQADHCDLCLTAADLAGGGLMAATFGTPGTTARHVVPQQVASIDWPARVALAYRSRAPPLISL